MSDSNNFFSYGRVITVHHEAISLMGNDIKGAIFLEHLAFWCEPSIQKVDPDGWVFKTASEWEAMFLSRRDVERARKTLRSLGILEEQKRGMPPMLWYRIDYERLREARRSIVMSDMPNNELHSPRVVPYRTSNEYERTQVAAERTTTVNNAFNNSEDNSERKRPPLSPKGEGEYSEKFVAFWEEYPRKVAKGGAWKAWKGGKCEKVADTIIASLPSHPALKKDREYIPHPATFLNQRRWEDDTSQETDGLKRSKDILAKWREENPNEYE